MKKKKQVKKDNNIRERMRGAVAYFSSQGNASKSSKAFAFLSIIHPEMSLEQRLKLAHSIKD